MDADAKHCVPSTQAMRIDFDMRVAYDINNRVWEHMWTCFHGVANIRTRASNDIWMLGTWIDESYIEWQFVVVPFYSAHDFIICSCSSLLAECAMCLSLSVWVSVTTAQLTCVRRIGPYPIFSSQFTSDKHRRLNVASKFYLFVSCTLCEPYTQPPYTEQSNQESSMAYPFTSIHVRLTSARPWIIY